MNSCIVLPLPISLSSSTAVTVLIDQLAEIRKFRYAKLMCENADNMPHIQPDVFYHPLSVVYAKITLVNSLMNEYG